MRVAPFRNWCKNFETSEAFPVLIALIISVKETETKKEKERKTKKESNKFFIVYN